MITSVLFDMGGTLEDIYVDAQSEWEAIDKLRDMLVSYGLDPEVGRDELKSRVDAGWVRYGKYRDATDVELKPIPIWRDYVLEDFHFPAEVLEPHCEQIAHMWEVTHYYTFLITPLLKYTFSFRTHPQENKAPHESYGGPGWNRSSSTSTSIVPADSSVTFS